ncbi:endolytic transglycosylase MltG [Aureibaculum sp. 2210JD6-5]|uniref:endolytic transglycosylase MltG n=1 Tax=Aureibaculum sp. 2210JD6-5 TaxID=3103957 RepID=UPI002AAE816D|nr:endolytic transglycosylase MltG [Aureibaculum sp. 2210JD6-5]MDY7393733.1 endolytic transglycosylase MltG [Aureibaculum sp. 2210JD6-5]
MNIKKIILTIIAIVLIVGALIGYKFYGKIYGSNVKEDTAVYIPTDASFDEIKEIIEPVVDNIDSFVWVANKKNYPNVIKAGKYVIEKGMSNNALIDLLRSGKQTPLTLTFNNQDTLEKLAGRIAAQIEPDSVQVLNALTDKEFLSKNNFNKASALGIFIPNSYEFYWNTSAESFRDRMLKEYNRFWNEDRIAKAKKLNMSKNDVTTLASIVQKETANVNERPTVAGLYLNRLKDGWALQADPTVIFALKQKHGQDYEVKRVLNADLLIDSPYNTYKNTGLPPAPIAMPDISSIDAVLNSEKHEYYYMCANIEDMRSHKFARTLAQHNANAREYQQWLNKQGVNR